MITVTGFWVVVLAGSSVDLAAPIAIIAPPMVDVAPPIAIIVSLPALRVLCSPLSRAAMAENAVSLWVASCMLLLAPTTGHAILA